MTDSLGCPATEDTACVCDPWEIVTSQGRKALFVKPPSSSVQSTTHFSFRFIVNISTVLDLVEAASTDAKTATSETGTVGPMGKYISAGAGIVPSVSLLVSTADVLLLLPSYSWNLYC